MLLTPLLVLANTPANALLTFTLTVQLAPAAKLAPLRETAPPLAVAVTLPAVQEVVPAGVLVLNKLLG